LLERPAEAPLSLLLQLAVVYTPFLEPDFSTASLSLADWFRCTAVASSVPWASEVAKAIMR
jgi:P-type Ca2+ transporter type 2C